MLLSIQRGPGTAASGPTLREERGQIAILADLSPESLDEILRKIDLLDYRESQALVGRLYHHRSLVFLSRIRRDPAGQLLLDYRAQGPRKPVILDLQTLTLFQGLELRDPVEVLFGVRLDKIERDSLGRWVVSFEPASGVFFTDLEQALRTPVGLADGERLREILRRQQEWTQVIHTGSHEGETRCTLP